MRNFSSGCFITLALVLCLSRQASGQSESHTARFPESRSIEPGKIWLHWSQSERRGSVKGFLIAYREAYRQSCVASAIDSGTDDTLCLARQQVFRREVAYYQSFVTEFYTRYPEDRDVPMRMLLMSADDRTQSEIHESLSKKE